ncbi:MULTISPECIES: ribosome biogenesis GTPase Der [Helicobacter]|uniref:ribosome biogenesis GTPase Der n=1 Tax=Helicobacter TaxID=209 RepID=UPI00051DD710|nr:ribosome biogenesis GTPase Der [Helicobacter sp. MIT 03-1616]TLD89803.1 ribosome biogenesis GTPase Der [Helicobacter sp. MIT 03-1616]
MKSIAILGKPNVGKSSLFNRLIRQHLAITSPVSGTTRDVKKAHFSISGVEVEIIDTGGLEKTQGLFAKVSEYSKKAALVADMVLYMVDGSIIPQDDDIAYFRTLQREKKPLLLVVNKVDNDKIKQRAWDFSVFGAQEMCFISVQHNRGITLLLESIFDILNLAKEQPLGEHLKEQLEDIDESLEEFLESLDSKPQEEDCIAVGIIGRVNVGKSSLLNALLGTERSVVSEVAGTTIDPVDEEIMLEDKRVKFIDTAGIRRAGKIEGIEKFALSRTNAMLSQSHIAILVLDASESFVELDEKISSLIPKHALGVIVVLNKWDKKYKEYKEIIQEFKHRFPFLSFAPIMTLSALNGRNINKLKVEILKVYERFCFRIPTSALNDVITKATAAHHIPSDHGKIVKIYYATQYDVKPPQIALVSNRPNSLHFSYKRYLINVLRKEFDFSGVPLFLSAKAKNQNDMEQEDKTQNEQERIEQHISKQDTKEQKASKKPKVSKIQKTKPHRRGDKNTRY